jgi:uncharacterized protein YigA (DUF484 family)
MTDSMTNPTLPPDLDADDVIAWLKKNPDFLARNPDVIDLLLPPKHNNGRKVADFQSYMIERLKADKAEAVVMTREVVETARNNMNSQTRIHKAILHLLEADSFDDFIQTITNDLSAHLNVDITTLVVEADGRDIPHIHTNGIRIIPEGTIDQWMQGKNILQQSDIAGIEVIYGAGATLVKSQALVRVDISMRTPPAIIAFGSRDPNFFHPSQGTELVSFLARVVERQFRSWLLLPH